MIFRVAMCSKVTYSELREMPIMLRNYHQSLVVKYLEEQQELAERATGKTPVR